jgi:hypothetical protein
MSSPMDPSAGDSGGSDSKSDSDGSSKDSSDGSSEDSSETGSDGSNSDVDSGSAEVSTVVVIIGLGVLLVIGVIELTGIAQRKNAAKARQYLEENRRTVQMALSRGSGPMIDDIAMGLSLPAEHLPRLGTAIQRHRVTLSAYLSDGEVTVDETEGFCVALIGAIDDDPVLAPYLGTFKNTLVAQIEASEQP